MRIPLIMASILGIVAILTDMYVYYDLKRTFPRRQGVWLGYAVSALVCILFLVVLLFMPRRSADQGILFIMWGFYAFLSVYVVKIVFSIFSIIGAIPRIFGKQPIKLGLYAGLPLGLLAFGVMWYGAAVTRSEIEVVHADVYSPRLPMGFEDYRIVQISDLHTGTWGQNTHFISSLIDTVNSLKPYVVFFTGDIVNRETSELAPFLSVLSRLKAPDGVYSVLGNHDYGDYVNWDNPEDKKSNLMLLKKWQNQIGFKMLNNDRINLISRGDTIALIGVENWGEPPFRQYGHLTDAMPISTDSVKHLNDSTYKILLSHNPEHWVREVTQISNIDLTLSGHTHAMQMVFKLGNWKWSPAVFRYKTWGGLYKHKKENGDYQQLYVNIGAGEVGMPFRIGAIPEITVITLHRGDPEKN